MWFQVRKFEVRAIYRRRNSAEVQRFGQAEQRVWVAVKELKLSYHDGYMGYLGFRVTIMGIYIYI